MALIFFRDLKFIIVQFFILFFKPVEFCSDMFLLPLGVPPIHSIDQGSDTYLRNPRPDPPPREFMSNIIPKTSDLSYYELLLSKLEFNNNDYVQNVLSKPEEENVSPPKPPSRQPLEPIFESQESDEML